MESSFHLLPVFGIAFFLNIHFPVRDSASFPDFGSRGLGKFLWKTINRVKRACRPEGSLLAVVHSTGPLRGERKKRWSGSGRESVFWALELLVGAEGPRRSPYHLELTNRIRSGDGQLLAPVSLQSQMLSWIFRLIPGPRSKGMLEQECGREK